MTNFNAGITQISDSRNLGSSSALTFNGGTLEIIGAGSSVTLTQGITLTGTSTLMPDTGNTLTLSGVINNIGAGSLTMNGAGTLVLNAVNTYTGATNLTAGITKISAAANLGSTSGITFDNGATLESTAGAYTVSAPITLTGNAIISPDAGVLTLSGKITSSGQLTKVGAGTLVLSSITSDYTGVTNFNAGITQIADLRNLGASSALSFNGGALQTTADLTLNQNITLNASGGTLEPNNSTTLTVNGVVSGPGMLTINGAGIAVMNIVNSYTGGTTITSGTLQIPGIGISSTGTINVVGGTFKVTSGTSPSTIVTNQVGGTTKIYGNLVLANTSSNLGIINLYNGSSLTAPAVFTNTGTINVDGTSTIIGNLIGGVGSILNIGNNVDANLTITGNVNVATINLNTVATGSNLSIGGNFSGTLSIPAQSSLTLTNGAASDATITNNGTINISGVVNNTGPITNNTTINIGNNSSLTLTVLGNILGTGNITGGGANNSLIIDNNFTNNNTIDSVGNISINATKSLTLGATGSITNYATFNINGNITVVGGHTMTMSGGTVNVNNNSNFNGNFIINSGNFNVTNAITFNSPAIFNTANSNINAINAPALTFNGGTHTLASFNVTGNVNINNGADVTLTSNATAVAVNNAGKLTIGSPLNLTGNYTVTGTHVSNINDIANLATFTVHGNADFSNGKIIVNLNTNVVVDKNQTYDIIIANSLLAPVESNIQINNTSSTIKPTLLYENNKLSLGLKNEFNLPNIALTSNNANSVLTTFKEIFSSDTTPDELKNVVLQVLVDIANASNNNNLSLASRTLLKIAPNFSLPPVHEDSYSAMINLVAIKVADLRNNYQAGNSFQDCSVWIKPIGIAINNGATDETLGYHSKTASLIGGLDMRINKHVTLGFAGGAAASNSTVISSDGSNEDSLSGLFMPYCTLSNNNHYLDVLYSYSRSSITTTRIVAYGPNLMKTYAKYPYTAHRLNLIYGYRYQANPEFSITPTLAFKTTFMQESRYIEIGNITALEVSIKPPKRLYEVGLGVNLQHTPLELSAHNLRSELSLMVYWSPGKRKITTTGKFTAGGSAFTHTAKLPKISCRAGVGLTYAVTNDIDLQAKYYFRFAEKYTEHTASLELRYLF